MQITSRNALWRALSACAKNWRKLCSVGQPKGTALPPMSEHIMRDIGLSPSDRALLSHHWPSRDSRHPFL